MSVFKDGMRYSRGGWEWTHTFLIPHGKLKLNRPRRGARTQCRNSGYPIIRCLPQCLRHTLVGQGGGTWPHGFISLEKPKVRVKTSSYKEHWIIGRHPQMEAAFWSAGKGRYYRADPKKKKPRKKVIFTDGSSVEANLLSVKVPLNTPAIGFLSLVAVTWISE